MENLEVLWPLLILSLGLLILFGLLMFLQWKTFSQREKNQLQLISQIQEEKKDLLNRVMSQDLPAYMTMTQVSKMSSEAFDDPYIPQHDEAELARLQQFYGAQNTGAYIDPADPEVGFLHEAFGYDTSVER